MKLSDAILKGCELIPQQGKGNYLGFTYLGQLVDACALGAALVGAAGIEVAKPDLSDTQVIAKLTDLFPILAGPIDGRLSPLASSVVEMNDDEHASREWIAEWLAEQGY